MIIKGDLYCSLRDPSSETFFSIRISRNLQTMTQTREDREVADEAEDVDAAKDAEGAEAHEGAEDAEGAARMPCRI